MRLISAILAGGLFALAAPASAQTASEPNIMTMNNMDGSCGTYWSGASPQGGELIKVTFQNNRDVKVYPAWINLAGYFAVEPEDIPPGGRFSTYTRTGYHWIMIEGIDWHCIQRITIQPETKLYTID